MTEPVHIRGAIEVIKYDHKWHVVEHRITTPDNVEPPILATYRWKFQAELVARFWAHYLCNNHGYDSIEIRFKDEKGVIRGADTIGYDPENYKG